MPGKHVRFAAQNLLYSPLPFSNSPSPAGSATSLPSPGPLYSPARLEAKQLDSPVSIYANLNVLSTLNPNTNHNQNDHTPNPKYSPLLLKTIDSPLIIPNAPALSPPIKLVEITNSPLIIPDTVHQLLDFPNPAIEFDISLAPTFITPAHHLVFSQPAVNPPRPYITLVAPELPWPITVTPASNKPDAYVTVGDVCISIHRSLRVAIHPDEYNSLPTHEDKHRVNLSYENRYMRLVDKNAGELEKRKGVKRVDFLMGKTQFLGLSKSFAGPELWTLNLMDGPRAVPF